MTVREKALDTKAWDDDRVLPRSNTCLHLGSYRRLGEPPAHLDQLHVQQYGRTYSMNSFILTSIHHAIYNLRQKVLYNTITLRSQGLWFTAATFVPTTKLHLLRSVSVSLLTHTHTHVIWPGTFWPSINLRVQHTLWTASFPVIVHRRSWPSRLHQAKLLLGMIETARGQWKAVVDIWSHIYQRAFHLLLHFFTSTDSQLLESWSSRYVNLNT